MINVPGPNCLIKNDFEIDSSAVYIPKENIKDASKCKKACYGDAKCKTFEFLKGAHNRCKHYMSTVSLKKSSRFNRFVSGWCPKGKLTNVCNM